MKPSLALALIAAAFFGCGHAKTTDAQRTDEEQREQKQDEAQGEKRQEKAKKESAREGGERRGTGPKRTTDRPASGDEVPVPSTASGLLAPGADDKIREKLSERGFTGGGDKEKVSTEEALRRFQRDKELPATGMPDHATVRALGLDPDDVFRRATPEGEGSGGERVKN